MLAVVPEVVLGVVRQVQVRVVVVVVLGGLAVVHCGGGRGEMG